MQTIAQANLTNKKKYKNNVNNNKQIEILMM